MVRLVNDDGNSRQGWFRFLWMRKGELTFWGPCNSQGITRMQGQYVTVKPEQVKL